ncbi:uncharacterized protein LOC109862716 [Pseudomyrmex gracilis]|uniref:uncharacterized protein LOC109862716 n=1 Tax=Pseudomyrmex gracilis TaxID=219809 RepID=UPI0009950A7F|nr:uncharacterized protein LOC109862716 [Pseudomyrmex gracilis]
MAAALGRLLPNFGGPCEHVRKLYSAVVHSVLMYGAPVWHDELGDRAAAPFVGVQRMVASRTVRAYQTVAVEAVRVLARVPPAELIAKQQAEVFRRFRELRAQGTVVPFMRDGR